MEILKAVILLGIMGLIFGAVLAFAAQKFAVEEIGRASCRERV